MEFEILSRRRFAARWRLHRRRASWAGWLYQAFLWVSLLALVAEMAERGAFLTR